VIGRSSLALRVILFLVAAQIPAFLVAWFASMFFGIDGASGLDQALRELAIVRTTRLVLGSVTRSSDGRLMIDPSAALRDEARRSPEFLYAAFDLTSREAIEGSSPRLVGALSGLQSAKPLHMHFALLDSQQHYDGHLAIRNSPFGDVQIAIYKPRFRLEDLWWSIDMDVRWLGVYPLGAILFSTGIAWFAMRRGLAPLAAVTKDVAHIDMNSLHQRLSDEKVPTEIAPLVAAMNTALGRLDASVFRLRRYTANAAHELRTPLAILRARTENAEDSSLRCDVLRDTSRMQAIVEQMLIAARLNENQAAQNEEVDLVATVRQVVAGYLPLAIESDRSIEFDACRTTVVVRGNKRAIECIVANLIDNALRAEPEGGTVTVSVRGDATIIVEDHGVGLEPGDREMAFEPFWRKNEKSPGTGLGLAITKELVDKLGGRIWIGETTGGGATFNVALPATARSPRATSAGD
jgi:signal transduction histidine kinase